MNNNLLLNGYKEIKQDSMLAYHILSLNNMCVNYEKRDKVFSDNSIRNHRQNIIKIDPDLLRSTDILVRIVRACKQIRCDKSVYYKIEDFQVQNQSMETRTKVSIYLNNECLCNYSY